MTRHGTTAAVIAAATILTSWVVAGPVWEETGDGGGDAGSDASDAQVTDGTGQLTRIKGETGSNVAAGVDFEDLYVIRICDPAAFTASTLGVDGGFADFNTQLWLFRPGPDPSKLFGRVGNDDTAAPPSPFARITSDPTDGSPPVTVPGIYVLGISGFNNDPRSTGGIIFEQASPTEISGPDGPGGGLPLFAWDPEPSATGNYEIVLTGATFATSPTVDCNGNNIHDACDIAMGNSADNNGNGVPDECECDPDLNDDDVVDSTDLLTLLAGWGRCPVPPAYCVADVNCDGVVDLIDLLLLLGAWG